MTVGPTHPFVEFEASAIEQSIAERFEQQARTHADRVAVRSRQHELTYGALNRAANQAAGAILRRQPDSDTPVALMLEHGASVITAILAVLKAGRPYVPLDPPYPRERNEHMLADSRASLLLTSRKHLASASELSGGAIPIVNLDDLDPTLPADDPAPAVPPDALAYILYTSGSTGQPKGVTQTHRNVLHEIRNYTNGMHIAADDRLLMVSAASFGNSVRTLFGALLNGAGLYPLDVKAEGIGPIADWLIEHRITVYRSVASLFRQFASGLAGAEQFPELRLIYLAGEPLYQRDVELFRQHFAADCILVNGLGSSESLTYCWYLLDKKTVVEGSSVPVGHALDGMKVLLLDKERREVAPGEVGEIAVRSRYLSPGYWQRPELTRTRFLPAVGGDERTYLTGDLGRLLPDSCLVHMGRKDFQVQIRGHRVETSEVEMRLVGLGGIEDAIVVGREDEPGEPRLVAYFVPADDSPPTVTVLRRDLAEHLPDYMIPAAFVKLEALPLSPNGKVDRRALPKPGRARPDLEGDFVAPRSQAEESLARIWCEVLDLDEVGVFDHFLELGGDSLRAARVLSRVRDMFGVSVALRSFFETPTVAGLAIAINEAKRSGEDTAGPPIRRLPRRASDAGFFREESH